jgi:hypothetical protein
MSLDNLTGAGVETGVSVVVIGVSSGRVRMFRL